MQVRGSTACRRSVLLQDRAALPVASPGHSGLYLKRKKEVFSAIQLPGSVLLVEHGSTWQPGARQPAAKDPEDGSPGSCCLQCCRMRGRVQEHRGECSVLKMHWVFTFSAAPGLSRSAG